MKLGAITGGDETAAITGFAIDHRKVAPGTIFGAFAGARVNGEDYIPAAIAAGAIAVVARPQAVVEGAVHIAAHDPRERFARAAAQFFAPFPPHAVAVTGTNDQATSQYSEPISVASQPTLPPLMPAAATDAIKAALAKLPGLGTNGAKA